MYLDEQYKLYKLAVQFVSADNYDVLYVNDQGNEIWLEKKQGKTSNVVRLINQGFDWTNHLKKDIAVVFQKVKAMKRMLRGRIIEIHNIYISEHAPVDNWELLKKPMKLNTKQSISMHLYYLSNSLYEEEKQRLANEVGVSITDTDLSLDIEEKERKLVSYKQYLTQHVFDHQQQTKAVFSFGKPRLTYIILLLCIGMFLLLELNGGSKNTETLIKFGAKFNPAIIEDGEWWRIISSMFLHIGLLHLAMNMIAVYYLGSLVERIYGSIRFLIIYFLAGIGGGLASFAFSVNIAAGASGALFGLFGALLFFGLYHRTIFFQTIGTNVLLLIGINIVFGFSVPQIDNGAHLGGLIAGFIASSIVHLPKHRELLKQLSALVIFIALLFGVVQYGLVNNQNSQLYHAMQLERLVKEGNYDKAIEHANQALRSEGDLKAAILFQRSYAYIKLNQPDKAIKDLEKSIELDNSVPEAHYNLASLYFRKGEMNKADAAIEKAYQLDPNNPKFIELYEEITGKVAK